MTDDLQDSRQLTPQPLPERMGPQAESSAPWRNIAIGAVCLAAVMAGGLNYLSNPNGSRSKLEESPQPQEMCNLRFGAGELITGRVVGYLSAQEALTTIQRTQALANGTISPDYVTQQRVNVDVMRPGGRRVTVLVPDTMTVSVGDVVEFVGHHRAPGLPCHYIPNLISRIVSQ